MALGPKLDFINPGDALRASVVQKNFQALVNFVRAIPINNLLQPYQTTVLQADSNQPIVVAGTTVAQFFGYRRVSLGQAPETFSSSVTVWMRNDLVAALPVGETVGFMIQKATPSGAGGRLLNSDTWTNVLSAVLEFDSTNTVVGVDNISGESALCTYTLTGTPSVAIADGDWIRCRAIADGTFTVTDMGFQLSLKSYLRL